MSRTHPGILLAGYLALSLIISWYATRNGVSAVEAALACAALFSTAVALESYRDRRLPTTFASLLLFSCVLGATASGAAPGLVGSLLLAIIPGLIFVLVPRLSAKVSASWSGVVAAAVAVGTFIISQRVHFPTIFSGSKAVLLFAAIGTYLVMLLVAAIRQRDRLAAGTAAGLIVWLVLLLISLFGVRVFHGWDSGLSIAAILAGPLVRIWRTASTEGTHTPTVHSGLPVQHTLPVDTSRDALTGAYNRRALDSEGKQLYQDTLASDRPVSVLMLDIDHFKQVNDLYGHAAGDVVLARFAQVVSAQVRGTDFVARYGGEEFAIILPNAPLAPAMRLAEKMRQAVHEMEIQHGERKLKVTTSVGVTSSFPGDDPNFADTIARADKNLYRAKRNGRNRVMADPLPGEL